MTKCTCDKCVLFQIAFTLEKKSVSHCPFVVLSSMINVCKNNDVFEYLFMLYFAMEDGADPYLVMNMACDYISKLDEEYKEKKLLQKIMQYHCMQYHSYKKYINDKKFATNYIYYSMLFGRFKWNL